MGTFQALISSFFLVVITTIHPMIHWTNYCMLYICYFGIYIYILHWNSFVALFLSASSDAFECTHTRPGSIQARGDNLLSILKAFTNSSKLQSARERESKATTNDYKDERAVFFDYLSWFLVRCKIYDIFSIRCFILLS
jgi:hypothetical protein